MVILGGGAVSNERGTPVVPSLTLLCPADLGHEILHQHEAQERHPCLQRQDSGARNAELKRQGGGLGNRFSQWYPICQRLHCSVGNWSRRFFIHTSRALRGRGPPVRIPSRRSRDQTSEFPSTSEFPHRLIYPHRLQRVHRAIKQQATGVLSCAPECCPRAGRVPVCGVLGDGVGGWARVVCEDRPAPGGS